ncbi:MAG: UDP-N-acetylmuramoyl-L-alanine--D-glutamate ligase [Clostridium argentinense]|uniref:UDP-N-acetylmuramoylalanine--D-glutamate ligase n=1 Tax=Clostridium faecium TaxID=2762223 RepID=A0ABR8YW67_9CLOT|nr:MULTISPECIES: UDP-N-acetylmuramoyl-L-alanine--D-glutamate ligase [Clostridium]MBD8048527.1 UDP-N-acetylmuramoyl-L-alanine--D-glutamate ligase [Clostridium faecium]MBS5824041.1 UDP-N-acetylmuramoyl-L-alanine--D-glutamate ligase [Clostridium argentinense]MDU1350758.1 UDP-N-acetylmuramoyl-L-alanine--D-glutamate ligase [Clostridium argentinense]
MKRDFSEFKKYILNKNVAVVGIGVSNIPLIEFLVKLGAKVTAFDKKNREQFKDIDKYEKMGVKFELGDGYLNNLKGFEVIFKTPSMRIDSEALVRAKEEGTYITSEMEEFVRYCPAKIYGITGSDGKTTTTTLIYNILKESGYNTWVGGNIGTPLFANIEKIKADDRVVLELSSFQLMTMDESTDIAVITNLSPNHLDMHKDMEEYVESKKNIYKYQDENSLLVLNEDNDITASMIKEAKGRVYTFSRRKNIEKGAYYENEKLYVKGKEVCDRKDIKLKGLHNVENLLAAFSATCDEVDVEAMKNVAISFGGVEHRSEFIKSIDGVEFYNDSIASSPTRTLASIKAFEKPIILIAGGYDKNLPFEPLAFEGYKYIKSLILLGATKYKIKAAFDDLKEKEGIETNIYMVNTLEEAVDKAKEIAEKGDIVTLSPACASFDMFVNFEVRGNKFKEIINSL